MKKIMKTLSLMFAVGAMLFGSGLHHEETKMARAAETVFTALTFPDENSGSNKVSTYNKTWIAKIGNHSWSLENVNNNNWSDDWTYVRLGAKKTNSSASIATSTAFDVDISKIVVTIDKINYVTNSNLEYSDSSNFSNSSKVEVSLKAGEVIITPTSGTFGINKYFKLNINYNNTSSKNGCVQISKIQYFKAPSENEASISLSKSTLDLEVGQSETITATVNPSTDTDTVTWSSDTPSVATVSNGTIEAIGVGTATITATSASGATASCTVTVTEPLVLDHAGTEDDPYSVADALKVVGTLSSDETTSEQYYVKGIVSSTPTIYTSSASANFDIKDEATDQSLYSFKIRYLNNSDFTLSTSLNIDDKIIIIGYLQNYNGNKPEIKEGYIHSFIYELDQEKINEVISLINDIGDVVYTAESKAKIDAARLAYDALNNNEKAKVENYSVLTNAETEYEALKLDAEKETLAQAIIDQINAIGEVTDYSKASQIAAAREAYNTADPAVKVLVDANGATQTLIDAETELAKYAPLISEFDFTQEGNGASSYVSGKTVEKFNLTISKGEGNSNDPSEDVNPARIYSGHIVTIAAEDDTIVISKITVDVDATYKNQATGLTGATYNPTVSVTASEDNSVVTIVPSVSSKSIEITTSAQVRIFKISVEYKLKEETKYVENIVVSKEKIELDKGDSFNLADLNATCYPEDFADTTVTWSIKSGASISIDENNIITAIAEGTSILTVTANDEGGASTDVTVNVSEEPTLKGEFTNNISAKHALTAGDVDFYAIDTLDNPSTEDDESTYYKKDSNDRGIQIGTAAKSAGNVKFIARFKLFNGEGLKVKINAAIGSSAEAGLKVYLGESQLGSEVTFEEKDSTDYTFEANENTPESGYLTIEINSTKGAMYLKSIKVYGTMNDIEDDFTTFISLVEDADTCTEYSDGATLKELYNEMSDYDKFIINFLTVTDQDDKGNNVEVGILEKIEYMEAYKAWKDAHPNGNNLGSNLLTNLTSSNNTIFILVVGLLGLTSILGYYFLNKKKYSC